ncbi:MAG: type III pantothenate kinase [candidate division Zixibacteria bacterium]|nr:type III pantothenate kinase [candidate division Zixibacteria bacterium]
MLLAIDIGNTDTVVGVFDGSNLLNSFRVASAQNLTIDEAGLFVSSLFHHHIKAELTEVTQVAICSVVPHLTDIYKRMSKKYFKVDPLIISSKIKLPFEIEYPKPGEIGADRLANAAAGFAEFGSGLIVVDMGTATTFDVISESGAYIGGVIAPGPQTAGINLAQRAARLFEVTIEKPERVIGKSTAQALKSGLHYGTIGLIDTIVDNIFQELGKNCKVIATGGAAESYIVGSKHISDYIPDLTLNGIRIIADFNSQ